MHTADPSAFFQPIDANNERYEELSRRPEWHFPSEKFRDVKSIIPLAIDFSQGIQRRPLLQRILEMTLRIY